MLGFWPHQGRLKLSIWRCDTGKLLLEHQLSETQPLEVDVHLETQHVLLLHGTSVPCKIAFSSPKMAVNHLFLFLSDWRSGWFSAT